VRNSPTRAVCALAIGGLDPGGGAGVLADVRGFEAAGAFGCAVVALLTVQSTRGVVSVQALPAKGVVASVVEVLEGERVRAIKVGALGSRANVVAVAKLLREHLDVPSVVDTPMLPTRGRASLLDARAIEALKRELLPAATLVTVNALEAETLVGGRVATTRDARRAAKALVEGGARAVLVKAGHLRGAEAVDVLAVGDELFEIGAPRLRIDPVHGAGCTLASLVAGRLAVAPRSAIVDTVRWAKKVHHAALARAIDVGGPLRVLAF
jgi:hydroxymethylpyrimidine/phosphomethylpyrimidine kinase